MRRIPRILLTALFAAASVGLAVNTANAAGCSVVAHTPYKITLGYGTAKGSAGRANCTGKAVKIDARLIHYQPFGPHNVRAYSSYNAVNWTTTLSWARPNTGTANGWTWYTEATSSTGQKAVSNRGRLWK